MRTDHVTELLGEPASEPLDLFFGEVLSDLPSKLEETHRTFVRQTSKLTSTQEEYNC